MTPPKQSKNKKPRSYQQHGLHTISKALASVGDMNVWLTEQGEDGEKAKILRGELIEEQDGLGKISKKELATIDGAMALIVTMKSIGRYIATMESPVNKVKRTVFPVVHDYKSVFKEVRETFKDLSELRKNRPKEEPIQLPDYVKSKESTPDLVSAKQNGHAVATSQASTTETPLSEAKESDA
jgi:hypothetical protein